jgi:hypothetical protein
MWRKNPAPKLVHSELSEDTQRRLTRLMSDIRVLQASLTRAQSRTAYDYLETARDVLSRLLDKADGKDA